MPISRGSSHVPAPVSGTRPRCTKIQPKRARVDAMRTSHWLVNSAPMPIAGPSMAPITGLGTARSATTRRSARRCPACRARCRGWSCRSERSVPAQKVPGAPVRITHAGGVVAPGLVHGLDEVAEHRVRHRALLLGAIDGDRGDAVVDVVPDEVGHAGDSRLRWCSMRRPAALLRGEAIVLPTDTVYGVAVAAAVPGAIAAMFAIKERPLDVPAPGARRRRRAGRHRRRRVAAAAGADGAGTGRAGSRSCCPRDRASTSTSGAPTRATVGVRVPDHEVPRELARRRRPARDHERQPATAGRRRRRLPACGPSSASRSCSTVVRAPATRRRSCAWSVIRSRSSARARLRWRLDEADRGL